jgi:hypothetical protein
VYSSETKEHLRTALSLHGFVDHETKRTIGLSLTKTIVLTSLQKPRYQEMSGTISSVPVNTLSLASLPTLIVDI